MRCIGGCAGGDAFCCGFGAASFFGARIKCRVLPSWRGRNSTIPFWSTSLISRSRISRPRPVRVISRPRKKMVALTLSLIQEPQHMIFLGLVVVLVHINAELDFLDRNRLLMFLGLAFFLLLLIQKLAVVHDAAYGRVRSGRDFRSEEHTSELQSQSNLVC